MTDNQAIDWVKTNAGQFCPPELRYIGENVTVLCAYIDGERAKYLLDDGRTINCKLQFYGSSAG
jgi:hypothetical protein